MFEGIYMWPSYNRYIDGHDDVILCRSIVMRPFYCFLVLNLTQHSILFLYLVGLVGSRDQTGLRQLKTIHEKYCSVVRLYCSLYYTHSLIIYSIYVTQRARHC